MYKIVKFDSINLQKLHPLLREDDVCHIREWLEKSPHLPQITDYEIFLFLHASKFGIETTKVRLDKFYTCRTRIKQIFDNRDVTTDDFLSFKDVVISLPLPRRTPQGYQVLFEKLIDPARFNMRDYLKINSYNGELAIWLEENGLADGYVFLVDLQNSKIQHLAQIDLGLCEQMVRYGQEALPIRIISMHFINPPYFVAKAMALIKPFLTEELKSKVYVHEKLEDLDAYIPIDSLPRDYGGREKSIKELNENHYKHLLDNNDFYLEEPKMRRTREEFRQEKSTFDSNLFGLDGNFKKLNID